MNNRILLRLLLVVYDKKRTWNLISLARGDVEIVTDPLDNPSQDKLENVSFDRLADPSRGKKGVSPLIGGGQGASLDESRRDHPPVEDLQMTIKDQEVHCSERYLSRTLPASNQSATTVDDGRSVGRIAGPILV